MGGGGASTAGRAENRDRHRVESNGLAAGRRRSRGCAAAAPLQRWRDAQHADVQRKTQLGWLHRRQMGALHPSDAQFVEDPTVEFWYTPHTLLALGVALAGMSAAAVVYADSEDALANRRAGLAVAAGWLLTVGLLVFPSGPFIRPHPLLWRLGFGLGVCYELLLVLLLFQSKPAAREWMKTFDASLGVPLTHRSYAENCALTPANVWAQVNDIFFVGHFVGWVLKSLMLRDQVLCWYISVTWELIEVAFMHMLPNFRECWWDQWLLDVLISNGAGIWLGHRLCRYLEMRSHEWHGFFSYSSPWDRLKRLALQFTPHSWMRIRWNKVVSIRRLLQVHFIVVLLHVQELNAFFLKHLLWVPPQSALNFARLLVHFLVAVCAARQLYLYFTQAYIHRIGNHSFLCICLLATELLVILKFGRGGEFTEPMQPRVRRALALVFSTYVAIFVVVCVRVWRASHDRDRRDDGDSVLELLSGAACQHGMLRSVGGGGGDRDDERQRQPPTIGPRLRRSKRLQQRAST